jgi:outer membrane protein TolC
MRVAVARIIQQEALTRATMRQWAPSLAFTGSIDGRAGGAPIAGGPEGVSGWLPLVPNWDMGLILTIPIFDGVILAKRNQSRAQEAVLRSELDVQRRQLLTAMQSAYTSFRIAQATLPALSEAASAAQRNYDQASARFRVGLSTSVELADAEALRTDAEIQLAVGRFDIARARAGWNRSVAAGL